MRVEGKDTINVETSEVIIDNVRQLEIQALQNKGPQEASRVESKEVNAEALQELVEDMHLDASVSAENERQLIERSEVIQPRARHIAGLFGRSRDAFYKWSRQLILGGSLILAPEIINRFESTTNEYTQVMDQETERRLDSIFQFDGSEDALIKKLVISIGQKLLYEGLYHTGKDEMRFTKEVEQFNEMKINLGVDTTKKVISLYYYSLRDSWSGEAENPEDEVKPSVESMYVNGEGISAPSAEVLHAKEKDAISLEEWKGLLQHIDYQHVLKDKAYQFGIEPLKRAGYQRYKSFNRDIYEIANKMNERIDAQNKIKGSRFPGITPGLLAATVLQEGFSAMIDRRGYDSKAQISSFGAGADSLVADLANMRARGLLGQEFENKMKITELVSNEKEMRARDSEASMKTILEGTAALLTEKRNYIIERIGEDEWNSYSSEEQDWITYAAYNFGQGNVEALLRDKVITIKTPKFSHQDENGEPVFTFETKRIPIENYPKYKDGKVIGKVENVKDFIVKDHGRSYRASRKDFHYNAAQTAVSAAVANKLFAAYNQHS